MSDNGKDKFSTDNFSENEFLDEVKKQLEQSDRSLSADDLRSLRLARSKAVESLSDERLKNYTRRFWSPAAGMATVASIVALVVGLQVFQTANVDTGNSKGKYSLGASTVADMPILSASEEFEFYEELEFYQWLEFEGHAG